MELDLEPAPLDTNLRHGWSAPTPLRGLPLLDLVIHQIKLSPDTWNQGSWRCETGMCVAGWAATLAGGKWATINSGTPVGDRLIVEPDIDDEAFIDVLRIPVVDDGSSWSGLKHWSSPMPEGWREEELVSASARAQALLGLDDDEAADLFAGSNTLETICEIRDGIAAGTYVSRETKAREAARARIEAVNRERDRQAAQVFATSNMSHYFAGVTASTGATFTWRVRCTVESNLSELATTPTLTLDEQTSLGATVA